VREGSHGGGGARPPPPRTILIARVAFGSTRSLSIQASKKTKRKEKEKDRREEESNSRLEKVRGRAVEHRFLILTAGELTGSGDSQAREEQSPSEFATISALGYLRAAPATCGHAIGYENIESGEPMEH
jgi:hypothetical protein